MASLKDVALRAQVSLTSASMILNTPDLAKRFNKETVKRVRKCAKELNYYTDYRARSFRGGKSFLAGVLMRDEEGSILGEPYWGTLVAGMNAALDANNYNLTIINVKGDIKNGYELGLRYLKEHRIDGLIVTYAPFLESNEYLEHPIVLVNSEQGKTNCPCVSYESRHGIQQALLKLKSLGHESICYIGPANWWDSSYMVRPQQILEICKEIKMKGKTFLFEVDIGKMKNFSVISWARDELEKILSSKADFSAVIGYNEECARGCYDALLKAGKHIPNDISVIAFDKAYATFFHPKLATIDTKVYDVGFAAGELLIERMNAKGTVPSKIIPTEFMLGDSVCAAFKNP